MEYEIKQVSKDFLDDYIDCWINKRKLSSKDTLLYCKGENKYIGVDNTTSNCWVEEFNSEEDVRMWLSGVEKEDIVFKNKKDERDAR